MYQVVRLILLGREDGGIFYRVACMPHPTFHPTLSGNKFWTIKVLQTM